MALYLFANNAETTLAVELDDTPGVTTMTVTEDDTDSGTSAAFPEFAADGTSVLLATLTHASNPGLFEVVGIQARAGADFTVLRAMEGDLLTWPVGTLISGRITAGLMASIPQVGGDEGIMYASSDAGNFQFGNWPTMQLLRTQGIGPTDYDPVVTPESWQGSIPVDLGTPVTWSAVNFFRGSVVVPTTPNGKQYWLDIASPTDTQSLDAVEPTWAATAPSTNGTWRETAMPVDISSGTMRPVLITEVGFIAHKYSGSAVPNVSIGTASDPTRFANNVALSQVAGNGTVHRIPLSSGGALVSGEALKFKVETAASGGRCLGRFYWRGIFIETNASL